MYLIYFYVPKESAKGVKSAMFEAGAGRIGEYIECSWECEGVGQFRALSGANPAIGKIGELERVVELKVEMVCQEESIKEVIEAMKRSHPYEEVAYGVIPILTEESIRD